MLFIEINELYAVYFNKYIFNVGKQRVHTMIANRTYFARIFRTRLEDIIIINPCLRDETSIGMVDIQFRIIHFTGAARRWLARTIRWRHTNVPCSSRESEFSSWRTDL